MLREASSVRRPRGDAAAKTASGVCREGAPSGRGRPRCWGGLWLSVTCSAFGRCWLTAGFGAPSRCSARKGRAFGGIMSLEAFAWRGTREGGGVRSPAKPAVKTPVATRAKRRSSCATRVYCSVRTKTKELERRPLVDSPSPSSATARTRRRTLIPHSLSAACEGSADQETRPRQPSPSQRNGNPRAPYGSRSRGA